MNIHAGRLRQGAPVREYGSAEEMRRHAAELRARTFAPLQRPVLPAAIPVPAPTEPAEPTNPPGKRWILVDEETASRIEAGQALAKPAVLTDRALVFRPREIARAIADHYGVTLEELRSETRTARIVRPRQLAMLAVWIECPLQTLPSIGRLFGKDHTTVLHAIRKYGDGTNRRWPIDLYAVRDLVAAPTNPAGALEWNGEGCA